MQEEILTKIESLSIDGIVQLEKMRNLLKILMFYIEEKELETIHPLLEVILEQTQATSKIFDEIELSTWIDK